VLVISVAGTARAVDLTQGAAAHAQQGDAGTPRWRVGSDVADLPGGLCALRCDHSGTGIDIVPTTLRVV